MKNKREDKQRERGRVTQFGVRGDNGIITLNYNNIHPPPPTLAQSNLGCVLFAKAVIKCLVVAKPALMR